MHPKPPRVLPVHPASTTLSSIKTSNHLRYEQESTAFHGPWFGRHAYRTHRIPSPPHPRPPLSPPLLYALSDTCTARRSSKRLYYVYWPISRFMIDWIRKWGVGRCLCSNSFMVIFGRGIWGMSWLGMAQWRSRGLIAAGARREPKFVFLMLLIFVDCAPGARKVRSK